MSNEIRDSEGRKYHMTSVFSKGSQGIVYRTAEGLLIKINTSADRDQYAQRYRWLKKKGEQLPEETRIAFPVAVLEEPYTGYVMKEAKGHLPLNDYMQKPEAAEDLWEWYFHDTGGLTKRLQTGYLLAKSLHCLHMNGYAYVDLSPDHIFVSRERNSLVLIDADNISSGIFRPLTDGSSFYMAPEAANKTAAVSTVTDTYSYAVLLFQILTACHPFIGDDVRDADPEWLQRAVDTGKLEFIGNPDSGENKNSVYETAQIFLTDELKELFRRMFTDGKMESAKRPVLTEFMHACAHAKNIAIQCDHDGCAAEYYYKDQECLCPVCHEHIRKVYLLESRQMVRTRGRILMPLDGSREMKPLDVYADIMGRMAVTKQMKYIYRSFFDEHIPLEADGILAAVARTKNGQLGALNLSQNKLTLTDDKMTGLRTLELYKRGFEKPEIIDRQPGNYLMFLDKNIDVTAENGYIDTKQIEQFYGCTEIDKFILIRQEGE